MYSVKLAPFNYSILGIYNDAELQCSFTSVDFYNVFDALCQFLHKDVVYTKPKLYSTTHDRTPKGDISFYKKSQYSNEYELIITTYVNIKCGYVQGTYTIEEYEEIYQAMYEYIKSTDKDMIFSCSSIDLYQIKHTPYSIYKDVYPNTKIDSTMMCYFIGQREWSDCKTIQDNIEYIHKKYDNDSLDFIKETISYKNFVNVLKNKKIIV